MAKQRRRKTTRTKTASSRRRRSGARKWSGRVTRESDALDLDKGVFKLNSPRRIAASLKRSAERSRRRKADAYRSALSMLTFYIQSRRPQSAGFAQACLEQGKGRAPRPIWPGVRRLLQANALVSVTVL